MQSFFTRTGGQIHVVRLRSVYSFEMTSEELDQLRQMTHASVQDENGVDVTQIDHLLSLTPTQRLESLEQFLEEVDALMAGREMIDADAERTP